MAHAATGYAPLGTSAIFATGPGVVKKLPRVYRVVKQPDGKVRVKDVPIFGANRRQNGAEVLEYGRPWLAGAASADAALRGDGYFAPMHFGHHEPGVTRERAGQIEITGTARALYQGKPTWLMFSDLVFDDEAKYRRAKKEFPYRSVEISPEKPNEINSLALLSSEAPYFRFPNLNLAYRTLAGGGRAFVWRDKMGDTSATPASTSSAPAAFDAVGDTNSGQQGDPTALDTNEADGDAASEFAKRLTKMEAFLSKHHAYDADADDDSDPSQGSEDASVGDAGAPVVSAAASVQATALRGANAILMERLDKIERERSSDNLFATLSGELASHMTPAVAKQLKAIVYGPTPQAAQAFASLVKTMPPARPRAGETAGAPEIAPVADSPDVARYAKFGAERLTQARNLAATYDATPRGHYLRNHARERFLAAQLGEVS